ncbi:hypothetical protein X975_10481, partial [Stegodyphus mimosarum]
MVCSQIYSGFDFLAYSIVSDDDPQTIFSSCFIWPGLFQVIGVTANSAFTIINLPLYVYSPAKQFIVIIILRRIVTKSPH